ncbi:hypothetical protein K432DRAFT_399261 [Lepidopterella palustris CBS 459.81]|uniref:Uncharacterized protein n=1 Tax=Lepidopterella palustris CBS 459.81 TaxID=1314670 RepID=A0A8E2DW94_9PEZI|nr:hypothetical protein K432DRAFT_399261 [Lepidopterella palustris CBS 459.81]
MIALNQELVSLPYLKAYDHCYITSTSPEALLCRESAGYPELRLTSNDDLHILTSSSKGLGPTGPPRKDAYATLRLRRCLLSPQQQVIRRCQDWCNGDHSRDLPRRAVHPQTVQRTAPNGPRNVNPRIRSRSSAMGWGRRLTGTGIRATTSVLRGLRSLETMPVP